MFTDTIGALRDAFDGALLERLPFEEHFQTDVLLGDLTWETSYGLPGESLPPDAVAHITFDWPSWSQTAYRQWYVEEVLDRLPAIEVEIVFRLQNLAMAPDADKVRRAIWSCTRMARWKASSSAKSVDSRRRLPRPIAPRWQIRRILPPTAPPIGKPSRCQHRATQELRLWPHPLAGRVASPDRRTGGLGVGRAGPILSCRDGARDVDRLPERIAERHPERRTLLS